MARKPKKPDLNVWTNQLVLITLKGYDSESKSEEGEVTALTVKGLFCHFDGLNVHVNTISYNPLEITLSIPYSNIGFIESFEDNSLDPKNVN